MDSAWGWVFKERGCLLVDSSWHGVNTSSVPIRCYKSVLATAGSAKSRVHVPDIDPFWDSRNMRIKRCKLNGAGLDDAKTWTRAKESRLLGKDSKCWRDFVSFVFLHYNPWESLAGKKFTTSGYWNVESLKGITYDYFRALAMSSTRIDVHRRLMTSEPPMQQKWMKSITLRSFHEALGFASINTSRTLCTRHSSLWMEFIEFTTTKTFAHDVKQYCAVPFRWINNDRLKITWTYSRWHGRKGEK